MKEALIFLLDTFSRLYLLILLLRFWLPVLRANFHNPISQGILQYTSPLIVPVRRIVPSLGKLDTATVLVAFAIQALTSILILIISQGMETFRIFSSVSNSLNFLLAAFIELGRLSVVLFIAAIIIRVVLSLLGRHFGPLTEMLRDLTEPLMRPVRRVVPPIGVVDLSAYIVIILLIALNIVLSDLMPSL